MKHLTIHPWKTFLYSLLFGSILLFLTTWMPFLYEPVKTAEDAILQNIQGEYQKIAKELKLEDHSFQDIVSIDDIKNQVSSLTIQKNAKEVLDQTAKESSYDLKEDKSEQLAIEMQQIYDHEMITIDTSEVLQQVRLSSLVVMIISECLLLLMDRRKRKKNG